MNWYVDKRDGRVAYIYKRDTAKGTVLLVYQDGGSTAMTTGTFNRYWVEQEFYEETSLEDKKNNLEKENLKNGKIQCKPDRELRRPGRRRLF